MGRISDGSPEGRVRGPEEEEGELRRQRWLAVQCGASLCFCFLAGTFVSSLLVPVRASARSFPATVCCFLFFFPLSASFLAAFLVRYWSVHGFTSSRRKKEGAGNQRRKSKGKKKDSKQRRREEKRRGSVSNNSLM